MSVFRPAGAVLAGGRSSRLGERPKALADLAGMPLVRHVLGRMQPQADPIVVSVQDDASGLEFLGHTLVRDIAIRHRGPLTGLGSAMQHLGESAEWLLLCPCDAPFLPTDLASRLHDGAGRDRLPVAVAAYGDELQPTFSLWHRSVFAEVVAAVQEQGRGGLKQMLREIRHSAVPWENSEINPFFNVNTPQDLAEAEILAARRQGPA